MGHIGPMITPIPSMGFFLPSLPVRPPLPDSPICKSSPQPIITQPIIITFHLVRYRRIRYVPPMKRLSWPIVLGSSLLALSALFYSIHYLVFHDAHHIFIYLLGDIGFVFIEVLLVTLIIHRVLEVKEKKARMNKINMVIGAFFSEVGAPLLKTLASYDTNIEELQASMVAEKENATRQFTLVSEILKSNKCEISTEGMDWVSLKDFLSSKREFLLGLLQNQNLLEHEYFTDVLWAVFHLTEELESRDSFGGLPDTDIQHMCGDMERVYGQLSQQWLAYMQHLETAYPYLFSLAIRTNPFSKNLTAVIGD